LVKKLKALLRVKKKKPKNRQKTFLAKALFDLKALFLKRNPKQAL
jgi:hypothetical protein